VNDMELFKMVTSSPARLWNMNCGELAVNKDADIVIAKINFETATLSNFFNINPENILMVIHKGNIRMFDKTMLSQLNRLKLNLTGFNRISINGDIKHVEGDLPTLMKAIRRHHPRIILPFDIYEENSSYHTIG
ncbi:MAG: amidohydrolase family protein, partial [Bacteroidota bacterium]|nr:amidohydrolase family protein [Bacteroidota bacterium]